MNSAKPMESENISDLATALAKAKTLRKASMSNIFMIAAGAALIAISQSQPPSHVLDPIFLGIGVVVVAWGIIDDIPKEHQQD